MVNMLKNAKKIVTRSFSTFVSFYYFNVPEEFRIYEIFFAILQLILRY